jgi:tetratricopeptide (TPR) repeat protein
MGYPTAPRLASDRAIAETKERVAAAIHDLESAPPSAPLPGGKPLGAEERPRTDEAGSLVKHNQLEAAEAILDAVITAVEAQMTSTSSVYICVTDAGEADAYKRFHPEVTRLVWLDASFTDALHLKGTIAQKRKQWSSALAVLNKETRFRPLSPDAFAERGRTLNALERHSEALRSFQTALKLTEDFSSPAPLRAKALRGIGASQLGLRDFPRAREAYEAALKLDPQDRSAQEELSYVKRAMEERKE